MSLRPSYVDSVRPLFDTYSELSSRDFQNKIKIVSQNTVVGSIEAYDIVSGLGTISSISVTNVGSGYTSVPNISIANPVDGTTSTGCSESVWRGSVGVVTVSTPGTGYTNTNPPLVLIGEPTITREEIGVDSYTGDYGDIVGVGTTSTGSQEQLYFDLYIPVGSFLRSSEYVGTGVTISGITTGDYLTIRNTNISIGDTFIREFLKFNYRYWNYST